MSENRPSLKQQLEATDLPEFKPLAGNADAFKSVREIEDWAQAENRKLADHIARHRPAMLNAAITQMTEERSKLAPGLEPPFPKKSIADVANERLSHQIQRQFAAIQQEKQDRIKAIAGVAQPVPDHVQAAQKQPAHPLKKDMHALLDRANNLHQKVNRHFAKGWDKRVENARARGSETPDRDVRVELAKRHTRIHKGQHRILHKTFQQHGIDRAPDRGNAGPSMG